jgi:NADH-quinone oxidoreductase subunit C
MQTLIDLEKKINSELTTKINKTEIKHNQIYIETDKDDLIEVILFLKIKLRQLNHLCQSQYKSDYI